MPDPSASFKSPKPESPKPKVRSSPGPGAYDPQRTPSGSVSNLGARQKSANTSSFKSSSKRGLEKELVSLGNKLKGLDPGSYSPISDRFGKKAAWVTL
ncbi:hypothetical protein Ctob_002681 [Chrysochromulina tobinii]|uniref:Uncharacterized protein n=1 Tax=Chrysochromulina tobinii TaxID=1460289 RepID=A0A0M0JG71_9EUKA|nr:hypothetical protein Ctob_002681 [Chrysochromulina tobinii]|eukprot:KOO25238.1 hypothetical protein Ctob_002681 [Chrysochromulina sp. CCMP291]